VCGEDTFHIENGQEIKVRPSGTKLRMSLKSGKRNTDKTQEQGKIG